jgi:phage terminase small subunit
MSPRERRFVAEYLVDANRTAAARRAGFGPSCGTRVFKLMQNPEIRYAIAKAQRDRARRAGVTRERVLLELARLAFADLARVASWRDGEVALKPLDRLTDDEAAAIMELAAADADGGAIGVRLHDKDFALEILARHYGLYADGAAEPIPSGHERLMAVLKPYIEALPQDGEGTV